jgi:hypothetical protein
MEIAMRNRAVKLMNLKKAKDAGEFLLTCVRKSYRLHQSLPLFSIKASLRRKKINGNRIHIIKKGGA